jgi:hypothetical protein
LTSHFHAGILPHPAVEMHGEVPWISYPLALRSGAVASSVTHAFADGQVNL